MLTGIHKNKTKLHIRCNAGVKTMNLKVESIKMNAITHSHMKKNDHRNTGVMVKC